jgi:hypothetical protein
VQTVASPKNSQADFSLPNPQSASSRFYRTNRWKREDAPLLRHFYCDARNWGISILSTVAMGAIDDD